MAQMVNPFLIDQMSNYVKRVSKVLLISIYIYTDQIPFVIYNDLLSNSNFTIGISHMKWENHNYFLSWREPWHKFEDWDWFNGRNFCRDRCMDLVSFDTPEEFRIFAAIMKQGNNIIKIVYRFALDQ